MDLLLSPDLFLNYLVNIGKHPNNQTERDLKELFLNPNNKFLLSKDLVDKIENLVGTQSANVIGFMQALITHLSDNQSLRVPARTGTDMEIMESMYLSYCAGDPKRKSDIFIDITFNENESLKKITSVVVQRVQKPNFDWIWFTLACHHPKPISVRYFDFTTNQAIEVFFENVFRLPQKRSWVDIFDRQTNLTHPYFNRLNGIFVNYFTYDAGIDAKNSIKKRFGRVNVFYGQKSNVHERRVVLSSLILEADEDFWNLTFDRPTWKIDITYCNETVKALAAKKNIFKINH